MGKNKEHNQIIGFIAKLLSVLWLVFFVFDLLVVGGVSVYFNLNYLLSLAILINIIDLFYRQC